MSTLTYVKGLPTPASEMNEAGFTQLEMFLSSYAPIFRGAAIETVNHLLGGEKFNKSSWNTHLQTSYEINKRHANGVISFAKGQVDSALEQRALHLKTIDSKIKSIESWLKKANRRLQLARKFYAKNNWLHSKSGCNFPLSCSRRYRDTNWQNLKFQIHGKNRKLYLLKNKLAHLKIKQIRVKVPHHHVFVVGSKDETFGNQVCQWDGNVLTFRVPQCLESKFGKSVKSVISGFERKINRLPESGAKTWHMYRKYGKWNVAVQFTPSPVRKTSTGEGCIGIDLNPGSIGWAFVDVQGNLRQHGKIPLQMGLPKGSQDAQIVLACLKLADIACFYRCPLVGEELDFSAKKERLGEADRKSSRMLSSWAYSRFFELLSSILNNRGIDLYQVNPAYSSIIGLVKYLRMYGVASDVAAAIVIARRWMRLSERLPRSLTAYWEVNSQKHVWSAWNQLNNALKRSGVITRRHDYYAISNWRFLVNQLELETSPRMSASKLAPLSWVCPDLSTSG